jgi:hypothetical protein
MGLFKNIALAQKIQKASKDNPDMLAGLAWSVGGDLLKVYTQAIIDIRDKQGLQHHDQIPVLESFVPWGKDEAVVACILKNRKGQIIKKLWSYPLSVFLQSPEIKALQKHPLVKDYSDNLLNNLKDLIPDERK